MMAGTLHDAPPFADLPGDARVSFEFFPPKSEAMEAQLWDAIAALAPMGPAFVSVTYGAGGSTRERTHATVARLVRETDAAIAGFVRGQTAVCLILGTFYAAALTVSGLNFGLLIGLISGLITFIPYVGSMTGLILSLGVAVAQFWPEYTSILIVLGIFLVGQFLEGNVLSPKLVGESVGLHPVWLIFALLAFGYLFGFVGLLIAVPLAATIGVLTRFALRRYLESSFYTGEPIK